LHPLSCDAKSLRTIDVFLLVAHGLVPPPGQLSRCLSAAADPSERRKLHDAHRPMSVQWLGFLEAFSGSLTSWRQRATRMHGMGKPSMVASPAIDRPLRLFIGGRFFFAGWGKIC
ncbi:MAG: hypothetical protein LBR22_04810, partial [Desulfovibrio sp.]|nr:hypothetical protein [Desulfovibrio sp.]